jgi:hypothetical protein
MGAFTFKLEREDGTPADPPTLKAAVPNWRPGDTIRRGRLPPHVRRAFEEALLVAPMRFRYGAAQTAMGRNRPSPSVTRL